MVNNSGRGGSNYKDMNGDDNEYNYKNRGGKCDNS